MNIQTLKHTALGIGAVILQLIFFRHLKILGTQPDFVLLFIIWFITKSNRTAAILMAAMLGLAQDAFLDIWGLHMFSKTLFTFLGYQTVSTSIDLRIQLPRVIAVVFIASLIHNLIFIIASSFVAHYTAELLFWKILIGSSIYTSVLAGIIQLFRAR
jgi:rod shape-determining protein MreD